MLIAVMILMSIVAAAGLYYYMKGGDYAYVYVDGVLKGEYALDEDIEVFVKGYKDDGNTLVIRDGSAYFTEASCPDKLCINQGRISRVGQELVCLPNRIIIKIGGKDDGEYDAVTQ